jgi:TIR domain
MSHIFISYSRHNLDYVKLLEQRLISEGFDVWRDNHLQGGEKWWEVVKSNIKNCSAMIVVMTPEAAESLWVMRETAIADYLEKPVFPMLLSGLITLEAWSIYNFTHTLDVTNKSLPDNRFYDHLARYAPRQPRLGGVRIDGIYVCKKAESLLYECLKFNSDETVSAFMITPDEAVQHTMADDLTKHLYQVSDEAIAINLVNGRTYICKMHEDCLKVRVEYPSASPDHRVYEFVRFEN